MSEELFFFISTVYRMLSRVGALKRCYGDVMLSSSASEFRGITTKKLLQKETIHSGD